MATIYSEKNVGEKHWNDTSAWVGGIVPGPTDTAYIENNFTRINSGSGLLPWTGSTTYVRVDSTSGFPTTSGSFYTLTEASCHIVKIDYDSIDGSYFKSCSIDNSFREWSDNESGSVRDNKAYGYIKNDAPVFRTDHTHIYLSGSSEWHVNRIHLRDRASFTIKDTATLKLDCTNQDSYVEVEDAQFYMYDQTSAILTGSTERNSSLIHDDSNQYSIVEISGSSDLRTRTTISSTANSGSGIIEVADSSEFEVGDIISIYGDDDYHYKLTHYNNNSDYVPYYYTPTGSVWPYYHSEVTKDEDETLKIVSISGNNLTVSKIFPTTGEVTHTQGTINKGTYQRQFGKTSTDFTGTKTAISVRSKSNQFKAGQKVAIGNNVYSILEVADKLIPYKTVDFENGDNLDDFWVDEYIGSGSTNEIKCNSGLITGSRLEMSGSLVGTSNYYKSLYFKDTNIRDLRMTMTGSLIRATDNNYNNDRMVGMSINEDPYNRDRVLAFYNRYGYSRASYIGSYGDRMRYGSQSDHWTTVDTDNLNERDEFTSGAREGDMTFQIDALRENVKFYYQGVHMGNSVMDRRQGSPAIHLRREGTSIKKVTIEEYVQELILDTTDNISVGSKVYLTGTEVNHPSGQKVVKLASTITDIRGYRNIPRDFNKNQNLTDCCVPVLWSNNGNQNRYRNSSTTSDRARIDSLFSDINHYDYYFRFDAGGQSFVDFNLGKEVTLDAIGLTNYYSMPHSYPGVYLKGIGVEYSTDGHNWSVARAQADDTRLSNQEGDYRIYQFSEITARFLRIKVNGVSNSSNNRFNAFGFYHFNGRGSTVEVNNTSDIAVGDKIYFFNPKGARGAGYVEHRMRTNYRSSILNGSKTASDYVGGITMYYTVTAKSGNVLTLDRLIEGQEIHEDTLVIKLNRSIKVESNAGISNCIPFGVYYSDSTANAGYVSIQNVQALSLGNGSRERWYFYKHPYSTLNEISNCSSHYIERQSPYFNDGGQYRKNNVWINVAAMSNVGSRMYRDNKIHGEIVVSQNYSCRGAYSKDTYFTGNIVDAGRYFYLGNYHSTPYEPSDFSLKVRGNYFQFQDYNNRMLGDNHGTERAGINFFYKDNTIRSQSGYYRNYFNNFRTVRGLVFEDERRYPDVANNGQRWFTNSNMAHYQTMGTDYAQMDPVYDKSYVSGRPYLIDNGRRIIIRNAKRKNQYDLINLSNNRAAPFYFISNFHVKSEQQIRVQQKMTYVNDLGPYYDNYLGGLTSTNKDFRGVLLYQGRTITIQNAPQVLTFTDFTFDHSFTALPGNYLYMLIGRSRAYNQRVMTFKGMSFNVTGQTPEDVELIQNGFDDFRMLNRRDRVLIGTQLGNQKVPKKLANRTTVKLRKFKF